MIHQQFLFAIIPMYLQCVLISRNKTKVDEQLLQIMNEVQSKSRIQAYKSKKYQSNIRTNPKFIDNQLSQQSLEDNKKLKLAVEKYKVDMVLVSPLKADLQTCYDLFGQSQQNTVVIEPNLLPRINSIENVPKNNSSIISKFKVKPQNTKIQQNSKWLMSYGQKQIKEGELREQGQQGQQGEQVEEVEVGEYISKLKSHQEYQTQEHFIERIKELKKDLITYMGKSKTNIGIVAHPEVLEALTATGYHEDYTFINIVPFKFAEVKSEFIFIEGIEGQRDNQTPFCSF